MPEVHDPEPVVVNTGPLLALGACERLELLPTLYSRIVVPALVIEELGRGKAGAPLGTAPSRPAWLEIVPLREPVTPLLVAQLDVGESAVVALAVQEGITRILMDERRGRLVGRLLGLQVTGSIGVLLRAKRRAILPEIRPCLEAMRKGGIWISDRLYRFALSEAGEA